MLNPVEEARQYGMAGPSALKETLLVSSRGSGSTKEDDRFKHFPALPDLPDLPDLPHCLNSSMYCDVR